MKIEKVNKITKEEFFKELSAFLAVLMLIMGIAWFADRDYLENEIERLNKIAENYSFEVKCWEDRTNAYREETVEQAALIKEMKTSLNTLEENSVHYEEYLWVCKSEDKNVYIYINEDVLNKKAMYESLVNYIESSIDAEG